MADTVQIYVKYGGSGQQLAHRVAEVLDVRSYFYNGQSFVLPVEAKPLIGVDSWAHFVLNRTDLGLDGDPGSAAGSAYEPYEFVADIDFRGARQRLGRAVFDRLTKLQLPMAYGDDADIFADYLPGRGVREFSPGTSADADGQPLWREPALRAQRSAAPAWQVGAGAVTVCETDGLIRFVPDFGARWLRPVASVRSSVGAAGIGEMLAAALGTSDRPGRDERDEVLARLASTLQLSTDDFLRRTVSFDVRVVGGEVIGTARAPRRDGTPGEVEELTVRAPVTAGPEPLGELVLDLVAALRARVPA